MKHEWRKHEKQYYTQKKKPEIIDVPDFKFFTLKGEGNPNDPAFQEYIGILYALSYGVKMSIKKGIEPDGYYDYTVYPLEGIWDLKEDARNKYSGQLNKNDLVYTLMIRQPDFVDLTFANKIIEITDKKKPHPLLSKVEFESIRDGKCIQMMHLGSYDNEPDTFRIMEEFAATNRLIRNSMIHREIYLSDFRKTAPEKLKTVLRFWVKSVS